MSTEIEIVKVPVAPSRARDYVTALKQARTTYLASPACTSVEVVQSAAADEVVAIVRWASSEAHEQARSGPHAQAFFALVRTFATGAPQVSNYLPAPDGNLASTA